MSTKKESKLFKLLRPGAGRASKQDIRTDLIATPPLSTSTGPQKSDVAGSTSSNSSESKVEDLTSNIALILGVVKEIGEILNNVPYVKIGAGILIKGIEVKEEIDACKEEWDKVGRVGLDMQSLVAKIVKIQSTSTSSEHLEAGIMQVKSCLGHILKSKANYQDLNQLKRLLRYSL
ncbi:hypothetical protein GYMLUDRAFT_779518 [Collybiopsis luxurians FD-317 M1]|uniref:Uncharacterized protein n=1 Tax=Collybiopsis luxurians FD-317 M1 TaxID=944289 RepID=A0A0D0CEY7_9AGAR|nr:hypothetical protein GYMLUDRAFT_779518 [Collybiopsis luxurians FD-317 M1]